MQKEKKIIRCEICGHKVTKSKNFKLFEAFDQFNVYLCPKHRSLGFKHSGKESYYTHIEKYMLPMNILDFKILYNTSEDI